MRRVLNYIDILAVAYCILYGLFDYLDFRVLIVCLGARSMQILHLQWSFMTVRGASRAIPASMIIAVSTLVVVMHVRGAMLGHWSDALT